MSIQENLPMHNKKTLGAMKADCTKKRITFYRTEASPRETLYVSVPKLNDNEVIVPGSLALLFGIDTAGGHANNFHVKNITCALVDKLVVRYAGDILQNTVGYDIFKRTSFSHRRRRTTSCSRASRVRTSARSTQARETNQRWALLRKPSWKQFTRKNTIVDWTTRSSLTTVSSTLKLFSTSSCSS